MFVRPRLRATGHSVHSVGSPSVTKVMHGVSSAT